MLGNKRPIVYGHSRVTMKYVMMIFVSLLVTRQFPLV